MATHLVITTNTENIAFAGSGKTQIETSFKLSKTCNSMQTNYKEWKGTINIFLLILCTSETEQTLLITAYRRLAHQKKSALCHTTQFRKVSCPFL